MYCDLSLYLAVIKMKSIFKISNYLKICLITFCFSAFLSSASSILNNNFIKDSKAACTVCAGGPLGQCTPLSSGMQSALVQIYNESLIDQMQDVYDDFVTSWRDRLTESNTSYEKVVLEKIEEVTDAILTWQNLWYWYDVRPILQETTAQNITMIVDQTRNIGSFFDAAQQVKSYQMAHSLDNENHKKYRPSENMCVIGTSSSGFTRANLIRRAMNSAMPMEFIKPELNVIGTSAVDGNGAYTLSVWDEYVARYCDVTANDQNAGCLATAPFVDQDIKLSHIIFDRPTLDIADADYKMNLDHLIRNIVNPQVPETMTEATLLTEDGRTKYLERRVNYARRGVVYEALSHVIARRMPGSDQNATIDELLGFAGVNAGDYGLGDNPSYEEIMNVFSRDRFRTGKYQTSLIESPDANVRERAAIEGFKFMHHHDQLDLMDRMNLLLATQVSIAINNN